MIKEEINEVLEDVIGFVEMYYVELTSDDENVKEEANTSLRQLICTSFFKIYLDIDISEISSREECEIAVNHMARLIIDTAKSSLNENTLKTLMSGKYDNDYKDGHYVGEGI